MNSIRSQYLGDQVEGHEMSGTRVASRGEEESSQRPGRKTRK